MNIKNILSALIVAATAWSCDTDTQYIGTTVIPEADIIEMSSVEYDVITDSRLTGAVYARSPYGYLGRINDPETGANINASYANVFIKGDARFYDKDKVKYVNVIQSDGNELRMPLVGKASITLPIYSFYGDSLNVMKVKMMELSKPLPEGINLMSDFDPEAEGYIRPESEGGLHIDKSFCVTDLNVGDSLLNTGSYAHPITFNLPATPYTASAEHGGKTYPNYGSYILSRYYEDQKNYETQYNFTHKVCPGFFFKITSGNGTMVEVFNTYLTMAHEVTDTTAWRSVTFSTTNEAIKHTCVKTDTEELNSLINDNEHTYIKSPAGICTIATLPVDEVMKNHKNDSISGASISFIRENNTLQSDYSLPLPTTLLMIGADREEINSFFDERKTYDSKETYTATYSNSVNGYTFSNISTLITNLHRKKEAGLKSDPNWIEHHPDWNKVALIPVSITTDGNNAVIKVTNQLSLASTKLIKGTTLKPIKLNVTYGCYK